MGTRMDDIMPVSICIPCYNNPGGVKKLLDSILSQTFGTFECIITDDSADDRTEEIVKPLLADGRFTYVRNAKALGSPENWNYCASLAKGAYIKIMHHDDWFSRPDALQQLYDCAVQSPDCGFIACGCSNCDTEGKILDAAMPGKQFLARLAADRTELFYANVLRTPSTTLIRRDLFKPFDTRLVWLVDLEQYMRILEATSLVFLPVSLVNVTVSSPDQITRRCEYSLDVNLQEYVYVANILWGKSVPLRASLHMALVLARTLAANLYFLKAPIAMYALLPLSAYYWGARGVLKRTLKWLTAVKPAR